MPSADFCSAVRQPYDRLSHLWATRSRSPGVSSIAFGAQPPDLRFASLMDMDFATSCPLVRRWRLVSGFCSSARTFAPRFLQTPPRSDSPCACRVEVLVTQHLPHRSHRAAFPQWALVEGQTRSRVRSLAAPHTSNP